MLLHATTTERHELRVPPRLVVETRAEFRVVALEHLELAAREMAREFVLELEGTESIDASGLGILVLIEKRARERGMTTTLRRPSAELRHLLAVTRLDYLFRIVQ